MTVAVVDNFTGDWVQDYASAKVVDLPSGTDFSKLNVCAVIVYNRGSGDKMIDLQTALARVKELYPDDISQHTKSAVLVQS